MKMRILKIASSMIGCVLALTVLPARAITYTLDTGNSAISGYPGPYGTVDVSLDGSGTIATITFTANSGFLFGDGSTAGLNVNASAFTVGTPTGMNLKSTGNNSPQWLSSGQADGFGNFNLLLDSNDGYGQATSSLSFTVTDTSGTWATAADVLTPNPNNARVVAHVFVT